MTTRNKIEFLTHPQTLEEKGDWLRVRTLNEFDLWVDINDTSLTPCLRDEGFWEAWITVWFVNNIKDQDVVLDVGANFGYYTMLAERLGASKVVAYEPNPSICDLLNETKKSNDADFFVREVAVADKPGTLTLAYPGGYMGSASVVQDFRNSKYGEAHYKTVDTVTLDDERAAGVFDHVDIIKIDVESAEELVWNGAREILYGPKPPVIVLEFTPTSNYSSEWISELFEYGTVSRINGEGHEEPVDKGYLTQLSDWDMLVLRRNV